MAEMPSTLPFVAGAPTDWCKALEEKLAARGWDQDHTLWLISIKPVDGPGGDDLAMVAFTQMPTPDIMGFRAPKYLNLMAQALRQYPEMRQVALDAMDGRMLLGIAFVSETWCIPPEDAHGEWEHRNWAEHPNRIEGRLVVGVATNGMVFGVQRLREQDAKAADFQAIAGLVPTALGSILDALRRPAWLG